MSEFIKPNTIDEEIILDPNKVLMSKTDKYGKMEFANDYFMEISGYEEFELMGKSMFCVQHPDMPEVIYKMMWEKLLSKQVFNVVIKNLAKSGKYYWSVTNFTFKVNDNDGEIVAIFSKRMAASKKAKDYFSKLYKTLLHIEKQNGILASEKFIIGYLEEKQTDFQGLVNSFFPNLNAITKTEKPLVTTKKAIKTPEVSIEFTNQEKVQKEIKKEIKTEDQEIVLKNKTTNNKGEKSLFQRLFGKTDEELEEERRRKGKKN